MIKEKFLEIVYDYQRDFLLDEEMSMEKIHYHLPEVKRFYEYFQMLDEDEFLLDPLKHLLAFFPENVVYTYMIELAKYFSNINKLEQAKKIIKQTLPIALISDIYGLAEDCYTFTKDVEFSLYLFNKAIKKAKKQNNSSRLYMIKQTLEFLARRSGEKKFLELSEIL